ncbi:synaptobrevin [Coniochaeta sp. 2T2.1]|nr:synaptobrevin [Coniochaeta sp. 2T2.1]
MARLSINSARISPISPQTDAFTDLTRLLSRLQQTVLRADAERERRLRTSEYERKKVGTNIDHARLLLTRLEQEALATKVHPRKQDLAVDLNRKRELLEQLTERLHDLEEIAAQAQDDDDDNSSDGEDILAEIIATPSESMDSRSTDNVQEATPSQDEDEIEPEPESEPIPVLQEPEPTPRSQPQSEEFNTHPQPEPQTTTTSATLRARSSVSHPDPSTSPSTATTTALLFGDRSSAPAPTTAEAILDHQRREQDLLSESILKIASDLKASSLSFSETLELDKDVVSRAGQGLDKNERGLEAAASRMGMLRRVTEGKGWWGRIMLYAWIYGLMGVLVVLVFGGPKLRF